MIIAFTDGSCRGNPGPGGCGAIILTSWDHTVENAVLTAVWQAECAETTNNREELKAILYVMEYYGKEFPCPLVYSDSAYSVNSLTKWIWGWKEKGWVRAGNKPVENLDLMKKYDQLFNLGYRIELCKVSGHSGNKWNDVADELATGKISTEGALLKYGG